MRSPRIVASYSENIISHLNLLISLHLSLLSELLVASRRGGIRSAVVLQERRNLNPFPPVDSQIGSVGQVAMLPA